MQCTVENAEKNVMQQRTYVGCLLSINSNGTLIQVWDHHSVVAKIAEMVRLVFDFVGDSPPLLQDDDSWAILRSTNKPRDAVKADLL